MNRNFKKIVKTVSKIFAVLAVLCFFSAIVFLFVLMLYFVITM